jgi:hypothetical protein
MGNVAYLDRAKHLRRHVWNRDAYAGWTIEGEFIWDKLANREFIFTDVSSIPFQNRTVVRVDWEQSGKIAGYDYRQSEAHMILDPEQSWALIHYAYKTATVYPDYKVTRVDEVNCDLTHRKIVSHPRDIFFCEKLDYSNNSYLLNSSKGRFRDHYRLVAKNLRAVPADPTLFQVTSLGMPEPDLERLREKKTIYRWGRWPIFIGVAAILMGGFYVRRRCRNRG